MINLAFKSTQPVGISGSMSDLRTEKETFLFGHPTERAEVEEVHAGRVLLDPDDELGHLRRREQVRERVHLGLE